MSAILDKLLKGRDIEWFQLGQVAEYSKSRISYDKVDEENYVGVDNLLPNQAGKTNSNYLPKSGTLIEYIPNDILIGNIRPYLKKIWHSDRIGGTNGDVLVIRSIYNELNPRYLYQVLSDNSFFNYNVQNSKGAKMPRGDKEAILKYLIPIPPLDVQAEIVRILDKFTAVTAELTAELNMREKQYQYYRNKLLSFSEAGIETDSNRQQQTALCEGLANNVKQNHQIIWKSLGEVVKIKNGKDWKNLGQGDIPVYGSGGIMNYVDKASYDKVSVLIPRKGTITNIFYTEKPFWNVDTIFYTEIDESQIFPKFLFHFMKNFDLTTLSTDSTRPSLTQTTLNKISIPLPSLNEQKRISNILDKFETLTHSITEGLPKEITLRQQQYEYYREQLLDFAKN